MCSIIRFCNNIQRDFGDLNYLMINYYKKNLNIVELTNYILTKGRFMEFGNHSSNTLYIFDSTQSKNTYNSYLHIWYTKATKTFLIIIIIINFISTLVKCVFTINESSRN